MGNQGAATPCLLTKIPHTVHTYAGKPGLLKLVVQQVTGRTDLDCANSNVMDITDPTNQAVVAQNCDQSSFGFQMSSGKKYRVSLTFLQLVNPANAQANLNEECGQNLDTITARNLFPRYEIEVA